MRLPRDRHILHTMRLLPQPDHTKRILALGLPIMAGSSSYVILGLADMLFVGQFGTAALAAVGTGSFAGWVFAAAFAEVQIAVQAAASRRKGAGKCKPRRAAEFRAGAALRLRAVPTVLLFIYTADIFALNSDPVVISHGVPYLQWMWLSSAFGASRGRGYWNGTDRPTYYMRVLLLSTFANVPLNYLFMFGAGPIRLRGRGRDRHLGRVDAWVAYHV